MYKIHCSGAFLLFVVWVRLDNQGSNSAFQEEKKCYFEGWLQEVKVKSEHISFYILCNFNNGIKIPNKIFVRGSKNSNLLKYFGIYDSTGKFAILDDVTDLWFKLYLFWINALAGCNFFILFIYLFCCCSVVTKSNFLC